jgi:hypothetical protein
MGFSALYENLLEQQEKSHAATLEEREQQKAWILQRQKLEQLKQKIATGIPLKSVRTSH